MKRILSFAFAITLTMACLYGTVFWAADPDGTLVLEGEGVLVIPDDEYFSYHLQRAEEITVGEGIEEIPAGYFRACVRLKKINLPSTLKKIGDRAFMFCTGLEEIAIPASVEAIGYGVFAGCTDIMDITGPDIEYRDGMIIYKDRLIHATKFSPQVVKDFAGIRHIDPYAFFGNQNVVKVILPDTIETIGESAFERAGELKDINIPSSLARIGRKAFYDSGIYPSYGKVFIIDDAFISANGSDEPEVILDNIRIVADYAFESSGVKGITIGKDVECIDGFVFEKISDDTYIFIDSENTLFTFDEKGDIYSTDGCLIKYFGADDSDEITLPEVDRFAPGAVVSAYKVNISKPGAVYMPDSIGCRYIYSSEDDLSAAEYAAENGIEFRIKGRFYNDFTDVSEDDWFYSAVEYAVMNRLMSGMSRTVFSPNTPTTRAMVVRILYNMETDPLNGYREVGFEDLEESWYEDAVIWAASNGIVSGMSSSIFAPSSPITREQFAAIIYNYARFKDDDTDIREDLSVFDDSGEISDYAKEAMSFVFAKKYITGMSETILNPKGNTTRAQAASVLRRYLSDESRHKEEKDDDQGSD